MKSLNQIQEEVEIWSKENFSFRQFHHTYLGAMEEMGELAHARLKFEQRLYGSEYYTDETKDAIGDLIIFLMGICQQHDMKVEDVVNECWEYVKTRNINTFMDAYKRRESHAIRRKRERE